MIWQDYVFTIGSLVLTIGILPMLWHKHKPPLSSSIPVFVVLYVFSATYLTLGFVLAPIIETVQSTLWLVLAWQRYRELHPKAPQRSPLLTFVDELSDIPLTAYQERIVGQIGDFSGIPVHVDPMIPKNTMLLINPDTMSGTAFDRMWDEAIRAREDSLRGGTSYPPNDGRTPEA